MNRYETSSLIDKPEEQEVSILRREEVEQSHKHMY
jgi:hypothetical protein